MHVLLVLKWQTVMTTGMAIMLDKLPLQGKHLLNFRGNGKFALDCSHVTG